MREYAFRFAHGSLRVNRILLNAPWYGFVWAVYFVSLGYVLLVDRSWLGFNFHSVILVFSSPFMLNTLVQSYWTWRVLERLNAAPVAAWRLVAVEANVEKNKNFVMAVFMGSRYGYDTLLLGKKLRVELRTGHWLSWQYDWQP